MKLIFAGTPPFAAEALNALIQAEHEIALVLTQPDRPAGRGMRLKRSAVKELALEHNLSIMQPESLKNNLEISSILKDIKADMMIVVAYGLLLPEPILRIPQYGCLNIHASLLPRWRGAAPIQRAIEHGDTETGITIMQMDAGLDTGDILTTYPLTISKTVNSGSLTQALAKLGADAIVDTLDRFNHLTPHKQSKEGACYAKKITKAEAEIDWNLSSDLIARQIRAFNPFPGAFTLLQGKVLKLWQATAVESAKGSQIPGEIIDITPKEIFIATGSGTISVTELQLSGSKKLLIKDFLSGHKVLCRSSILGQ